MSGTKSSTEDMSGGVSLKERKQKLLDAFKQKSTGGGSSSPHRGSMADALETMHGELQRVEAVVLKATSGGKPAVLDGMFGFAKSVIASTRKRVGALGPEVLVGAKFTKAAVLDSADEVEKALAMAKATQVDLSLTRLTKLVSGFRTQADNFENAKLSAEEQSGQKRTDELGKLYKLASSVLTDVSRELTDWQAQVGGSQTWLAERFGDFKTQVEALIAVQTTLNGVVEACLPKLTSRPAREGEKPQAGQSVPVPEILDAATALKDCGFDWVTCKQTYGADKTQMQKLADYRKKLVDDWLVANLTKRGLKLGTGQGWVSVGSSDPTSDYDISVNKHGTVDGTPEGKPYFDYQMVQDFNGWFRGKFGAEAGTVFDTNLYASAPPMVKNTDAEKKKTNDVAALMKLRRYMSSGEFEAFREETVAACGADIDKEMAVNEQFILADSNYRIVVLDLIESGKAKLEQKVKDYDKKSLSDDQSHEIEFLHTLEDYLNRGQTAKGIESFGLVDEGEELARKLEHHAKDATLLTTNDVYAEKIGDVRRRELVIQELNALASALAATSPDKVALAQQLADLKLLLDGMKLESRAVAKAQKALDSSESGAFETALEGLRTSLSKELETRVTQLGAAQSIAKFFANEAYQSDGPFEHIVTATQAAEADATAKIVNESGPDIAEDAKKGKSPAQIAAIRKAGGVEAFSRLEKTEQDKKVKEAQTDIDTEVRKEKKLRQSAMTADDCLTSFNEQLGDFLKDLEHYGEDDPGKAIIQSSKYLERLIDAVRLLHDKDIFADAGKDLQAIEELMKIQGDVKGLLIAARKGNLMLMPEGEGAVNQEEQRRAFACEFMRKLGVTSVAGLGKKYTAMGVRVNAIARKAMAKQD